MIRRDKRKGISQTFIQLILTGTSSVGGLVALHVKVVVVLVLSARSESSYVISEEGDRYKHCKEQHHFNIAQLLAKSFLLYLPIVKPDYT